MSEHEIITGTIPAAAGSGARLDKALAEATGFSRSRVQGLIDQGRIDVAGKTATSASMKVAEGAPFRHHGAQGGSGLRERRAQAAILPGGIIPKLDTPEIRVWWHPAPGTPSGTLVNALLHHFGGRLCRASAASGGPASSTGSTRRQAG